jgi:transcriptional regulator with XRE-family HTH domain
MFVTQTVYVVDNRHVLGYTANMANDKYSPRRELYLQLGKRIRAARKDAGLTQAELAASISLSRTSVTNIERGRQQILLHTLYDIASTLGIDAADLLPEMEPKPKEGLIEQIPEDLTKDEREWIESLIS